MLLWAVALAVGLVLAPRLPAVAVTDPFRFFPDDSPIRVANRVLAERFPEARAASFVAIVLEAGEGAPDLRAQLPRVAALSVALRSRVPPSLLASVLAPSDDAVLGDRLIAGDGRAALVVVRITSGFASEESSSAAAAVESIVETASHGWQGELRATLTGDTILGRDYLVAIEEGAQRSALATVLLVAITLLLAHRAPFAAAASLATLAVAIAVASGAAVLAARAGLPVAFQVRGFLVALIWGVGTDYCLLLFARIREEAALDGDVPAALVRARRATTPVIVTSALAVGVACAAMGFARFGLFSYSGPMLAIGVGVVLLAVWSLAPALAQIAGRRLFWPSQPRAETGRLWAGISRLVVGRPLLVSAVGLALLAPWMIAGLHTASSYEVELDVPERSASERGFAALARHFDPAQVSPVVIALDGDGPKDVLRRMDGLDALHQLSQWLSTQPGVARVWSATRPTGEAGMLDRARLASQLARLSEALDAARDGAELLATGLREGRRDLEHGRAGIAPKKQALEAEQHSSLIGAFAPERFAAARHDLDLLDAQLARLGTRLDAGTEGAATLGSGLDLAAGRLHALREEPGAERVLDRLTLVSSDVAATPELQRALAHHLSHDGRAARFEVQLSTAPNAPASLETLERIESGLRILAPALGVMGARVHSSGPTAITRDLADLETRDMERLDVWILAAVFVVLVLLLRGWISPAVITAFILASFFAALGALRVLIACGVWRGLDWKVPFFLFVLLVAIGADYGVFVLARAREEASRLDWRSAVARALEATGPVVTRCGLVLAGTFATLVLSRIAFLEQVGVGITIGVLIDTGLVRPFLLPAATILLDPGPIRPGAHDRPPTRIDDEPRSP